MQALLINPPINTSLPADGVYPMGLGYIAAILKQEGVAVDVLDIRLNGYDKTYVSDFLKKNKGKYDLYGIGGMVTTYSYMKWLSREIRNVSPRAIIIAGGSICTAGELLLQQSEVDIVGIGDGENTVQAIARCLAGNGDFSAVPNALVKKDGGVV